MGDRNHQPFLETPDQIPLSHQETTGTPCRRCVSTTTRYKSDTAMMGGTIIVAQPVNESWRTFKGVSLW